MNTGTSFPRPARRLLPVLSLFVIALAQTSAATDGVPLSAYGNGRSAYLIGDFSTSHFQLPDQLATKGDFRAFDLAGQAAIPIRGIRGVFEVSDSILINGVNARKEISANVGIGYELGSFGELEVFSDSSAGPLARYGNGTDGAINLSTKRVPIGSHLSAAELRPAGVYKDIPPVYSRNTVPARAVWAYGTSFTAEAVGVVTEDSAFRIAEIGDEVPTRQNPAPNGTGSTFTEFDSFSVSLSARYVAYKGRGEFFNGIYTQSFDGTPGARFTVGESFALDPANFGEMFGCFFRGDREVIFGTDDGIYRGDAEGATPPEIILENGTEYEPGKFYRSGLLHHASGDWAAIAGSGDNFISTIFLLNLVDLSVTQIAQQGEAMPGGGTFGFVQRPAVSETQVVFEGFDDGFQFAGIFSRRLDTWELDPILRVGDIFDGREVRTVSFYPGALDGNIVGFVAYYTDDSSGAYLATMDFADFMVPFGNLSTRLAVGTGDRAGIGGFINTLNPTMAANATAPLNVGAKQVVIRAIGPSLGAFGVDGPLADPVLELHLPDGSVVTNDNWRETQEAEIMAAGLAPSDDLESAILTILEPGAYTAIVRGSNGGTGVGLVEIYDLDGAAISELGNISTRGSVETGDGVMIGGFIVSGAENTASTMVVRAIGPSLEAFGVADALQDPTLELHDGSGALIASNDNWKETQEEELEAAGLGPSDDREAAILIALGPGAYTAIVRGAGETSGVALVEAYNLEAGAAPAALPLGLTNLR